MTDQGAVGRHNHPTPVSELHQLIDLQGNFAEARALHYKLFPLMQAMFFDSNPTPAKQALELMGKIQSGTPRQPLASMTATGLERLKKVIADYGLI